MPAPPPIPEHVSKLNADPDQRLLDRGWLFWFAWLLAGGSLLWRDVRGGELGLISIVLVAPFWGLWLLWLIWRGWMRARALFGVAAARGEDGGYFEFDSTPICVVFDEDVIRLSVSDVCAALRLEGRACEPDHIAQIAGRDGIGPLPGRSGLFFTERGLRAWLERRSDQSAAKFQRWFETQVSSPYRRRREITAT